MNYKVPRLWEILNKVATTFPGYTIKPTVYYLEPYSVLATHPWRPTSAKSGVRQHSSRVVHSNSSVISKSLHTSIRWRLLYQLHIVFREDQQGCSWEKGLFIDKKCIKNKKSNLTIKKDLQWSASHIYGQSIFIIMLFLVKCKMK